MIARLRNYRKLIAASASVAAVWADVAVDGVVSSSEAETLIVAGVGLFFVWLVKNDPPAA